MAWCCGTPSGCYWVFSWASLSRLLPHPHGHSVPERSNPRAGATGAAVAGKDAAIVRAKSLRKSAEVGVEVAVNFLVAGLAVGPVVGQG